MVLGRALLPRLLSFYPRVFYYLGEILNAEDWISLKKQLQRVTMFMQHCHIAVMFLIHLSTAENIDVSMGLLMVRTASEKAGEMLAYAYETRHEKIIRGVALGIALTVYGREEADTLIEQMTRDQDPIIRYGGMYALALVYSGTSNNKAIR